VELHRKLWVKFRQLSRLAFGRGILDLTFVVNHFVHFITLQNETFFVNFLQYNFIFGETLLISVECILLVVVVVRHAGEMKISNTLHLVTVTVNWSRGSLPNLKR